MKQKLKDFIKHLGNSEFVRTILAYICHIYIYFVYKTSTIIIKGDYQNILDYVKSGKGVVLMTWHGRILISPLELMVDKALSSLVSLTLPTSILFANLPL